MNVATSTETLRSRTRISAHARTNEPTIHARGIASLRRFDVPNAAGPNETIDATVEVNNDATVINPLDANACNPSDFWVGGLQLEATLYVDGRVIDSSSKCVPGTGAQREFPLTWATPSVPDGEEEQFNVTVKVRGANAGGVLVEQSRRVTVRGDAPAQPRDPDDPTDPDDPANEECQTLVDVLTKGQCTAAEYFGVNDFAQKAGYIAVAFVLVFVLASAR